jgi:hypothetical protein
MAKIRALKPETWTDGKFLRLSPLARLLFLGMWNLACDNGHLDDDSIELKIRLLPMDDVDVDALLSEMVSTGQVERHDGYLKVVNLARHQRVDLRYLALCEWCAHDERTTYDPTDKQGHTRGTRRAHNGGTASARGVPATDGDGDGDGDETPSSNAPRRTRSTAPKTDEDFEAFWAVYPRRDSKKNALKAWVKAKGEAPASRIILGAKRYAEDPNREQQFTKLPATWLNAGCWDDDPLPARTNVVSLPAKQPEWMRNDVTGKGAR